MTLPSAQISPKPKTSRGERTRQKILAAAEQEFGEKGYYEGSVSGITARAGIGQGTFYIYFKTKEEVLRELVIYMGGQVRHHLSVHIASCQSREEAEAVGMREFFNYIREHKNLYRIVLEIQFVDEEVYRNYYESFAEGYLDGLQKAQLAGEVRSGDIQVWTWSIMGMVHLLGLKYALWSDDTPLETVVSGAMDLLANGLIGRGK